MSPAGKDADGSVLRDEARIAAFFDLDGTLMPEPSAEKRFWRALRSEGAIPIRNYPRWIWQTARTLLAGQSSLLGQNKNYLRNVPATGQEEKVARALREFFEEAVERVLWHAGQGHRIVIVSGTLEPLALRAAWRLRGEIRKRGIEAAVHICSTQLEELDGRWTGRILGEPMFGPEKALAIKKLAKEWKLELAQCTAYGNSLEDRWMLDAVGKAVAVNASRGLGRVAKQSGWAVLWWSHTAPTQIEKEGKCLETSQKVAPF